MTLKDSSSSSRTKRVNVNHHYRLITREKGRIKSNEAWHPPKIIFAPEKMQFTDTGGYKYVMKAKDSFGESRTLTITSQIRYSMKSPEARKTLKKAMEQKYEAMDDEKGRKYRFIFSSMRFRFSMNLGTGQRWR